MKRFTALLLALLLSVSVAACGASIVESAQIQSYSSLPEAAAAEETSLPEAAVEEEIALPDEYGYFYDAESVILYLEAYGTLPDNFITKSEARELGWEGGTPERFVEGSAIGGDRFGNYEGLLPKADSRSYTECDIDTLGAKSRGAKRLVFSNDGLYFYTEDHYESFTEAVVTEEFEVLWK